MKLVRAPKEKLNLKVKGKTWNLKAKGKRWNRNQTAKPKFVPHSSFLPPSLSVTKQTNRLSERWSKRQG